MKPNTSKRDENKGSDPFDLASASREALAFAVRQGDSLRTKLAPIAAHIFDGDDVSAMTARLETMFKVCRGESLAAKSSGRKEQVKAVSKAWNRLADGLKYHAGTRDLSLSFPNLASGDGALRVESKPDASNRRKVEKEAREQADSEALALFRADQAQAQLDALRAMSLDELVESVAQQIEVWRGDATEPRLADVMISLAARLGTIGEVGKRLSLPAVA